MQNADLKAPRIRSSLCPTGSLWSSRTLPPCGSSGSTLRREAKHLAF